MEIPGKFASFARFDKMAVISCTLVSLTNRGWGRPASLLYRPSLNESVTEISVTIGFIEEKIDAPASRSFWTLLYLGVPFGCSSIQKISRLYSLLQTLSWLLSGTPSSVVILFSVLLSSRGTIVDAETIVWTDEGRLSFEGKEDGRVDP